MNGWRFRAGYLLLGLAVAMPLGVLTLPLFGLPLVSTGTFGGLLVAGTPETLCLIGVALLGRNGPLVSRARASRLRYYGGLTYCLLNGVPIYLYAWAPHWMPGGSVRYLILAVADLSFILSLFLMGGEFWEKFRRLFIWEGGGSG